MADRMAILALEHDAQIALCVGQQRNDHDRARMHHVFARRLRPIGQGYRIAPNPQEICSEEIFPRDGALNQMGVALA